MLTGVVPPIVAALWGMGSVQLLVTGWLATANLYIAIVAMIRGRLSPARGFGAVAAAVATGLVCTLLLRGGFWLLLEAMALGRTRLEQVIYWTFVVAASVFLLRRMPGRVRQSWRTAMAEGSDAQGDAR
jgi:hypothetical protein